ncbi:MAG: universal stress protein [Streptomycetaceae bacterium]|nr:universal stress protein [Streptomycetaceae bacterium]
MTRTGNRIVVGVDDTYRSRIAVDLAVAEAVLRQRPLHVVHADPFGQAAQSEAGSLPDEPGYGVVAAMARARAAAPEVAVTGEVARGFPQPVLIAASREAELVVIGDRGLGAVARALYDTVAGEVTLRASCPVLVARTSAVPDGPVVVGVGGSGDAQAAVGFAAAEADLRGCAVLVLHAWSRPGPHAPGSVLPVDLDRDSVHARAERLLSETIVGWREKYPGVDFRTRLVHGHARQALMDAGQSAALLVVGTRGRTEPPVWDLGSVSRYLLHHAPCPLAVVPHHRNNRTSRSES